MLPLQLQILHSVHDELPGRFGSYGLQGWSLLFVKHKTICFLWEFFCFIVGNILFFLQFQQRLTVVDEGVLGPIMQ